MTEEADNTAQGCLTALHNGFCISITCLMWQSSHSSISFVLLCSLRCRLEALLRNNESLDISPVLICMLLKVGVYTQEYAEGFESHHSDLKVQ